MSTLNVDPFLKRPSCDELFRTIEARFEASGIPSDKWYLVALSSLTSTPEPHLADQLYLYLTRQPAYSTPTARKSLVRRMRETLIKDTALCGLPKTAEAILAIGKVVMEADLDNSFSREGWMCDGANHKRAMAWLERIYAQNTETLINMFRKHPDFEFWIVEICYGLHLSDRQILDDLDTEIVVLGVIMGQNLPRETHWHIRGLRRLGLPKEDVQMVCDCVHEVAQFCGFKLDRIPSVESLESEL
jgi:hypothetical protein